MQLKNEGLSFFFFWKCLFHISFELVFIRMGVSQSFWRTDLILKGNNALFTKLFKMMIFNDVVIAIKVKLMSYKSQRWRANDTI